MRLIKNTFIVVIAMMVVGGGSAVAGSMITGKQVKNSSLTGKDIKNKSLTVSDLSQNSRDALKGGVGPAGPQGQIGLHSPLVERFSSSTSETTSAVGSAVFQDVEINVPQGVTKLLVHFNAECGVADPSTYRELYVNVRVDGEQLQGPAIACSNTIDFDEMRYSSFSLQRWIDVTPGSYSLRVNYWLSNDSGVGRLNDKTLTVLAAH